MKFFILALIFLPGIFKVSAQTNQTPPNLKQSPPAEPCKLKASDSPTVRGLRLNMTKAAVRNEYPLMNITADSVNSSGTALAYQIARPEYRENIDRITIMFRNDKVFSILFSYGDLVKWDSAEEFAAQISKSLNLPKAVPRKRANSIYYAVNCADFRVRTRINNEKQPTLFITLDPDEIWETTKEQKDAFKP